MGDHDIYQREGTEQLLKVETIYVHDAYSRSVDRVGDIGLIKLRQPARDTKWVQPACLLTNDEERFQPGHVCATTGWGRTNPDVDDIEDVLRQAEVPVLDHNMCQNNYWPMYNVFDSMVCAGGMGSNSCKGDSGGPLVCRKNNRYYLVGITSWGDTRCKPNIPGVYTRLQSYITWMANIMNQDQCND
uniref:Peptidase S1 domain-containing protein n=1 Tax=Ciona savignyi TaxID=51511 RepID=H2YK43_CIOSA